MASSKERIIISWVSKRSRAKLAAAIIAVAATIGILLTMGSVGLHFPWVLPRSGSYFNVPGNSFVLDPNALGFYAVWAFVASVAALVIDAFAVVIVLKQASQRR